jgi:uncharacterized membrane protein
VIDVSIETESATTTKTAIFVAIVVCGNTFGNLLLSIAMNHMPSFYAIPLFEYVLQMFTNAALLGGTFMLAAALLAQLALFTWADLTYVLPVTSSAYLLTVIVSKYFLDEQISLLRWIGVGLISVGVAAVSATPLRTKPPSHHGEQ